jgi:membrane-associated protease RseP (regulator of RpoE activity)
MSAAELVVCIGLAYVCCCLVYTGTQWLALRLARVPVTRVQLFFGKELFSFSKGDLTLAVGFIPLGSFLTQDRTVYNAQSLGLRIALPFAGPLALAVFGLLALGWNSWGHQILTGYWQLPWGALHPRTEAQALIAALHQLADQSIQSFVGVIVVKTLAMNLLPTAFTPVGGIFVEPFKPEEDRQLPRVVNTYLVVSALASYAMMGMWIYAVGAYVWKAGQ